ncbi:MAG: hypothetical protein PUD20_06330 [bacterium]|nr:hypothetical protein [bacterium]
MSLRPIDFNGMMQNQQGVSTIKHQEDSRPQLQQQQALASVVHREDENAHQVSGKEDMNSQDYRYDARDGKGGSYRGNQNKKKNSKQNQEDGHVRIKGMSSGFDVSI